MLVSEPEDPFLNYAYALELEKETRLADAVEVLENLLKKNAEYLGAYYKLGNLYEAACQKQNAAWTYKKGMEIARKQNNIKTFSELSEALLQTED